MLLILKISGDGGIKHLEFPVEHLMTHETYIMNRKPNGKSFRIFFLYFKFIQLIIFTLYVNET